MNLPQEQTGAIDRMQFEATGTGARGAVVNRTHRIVRERAKILSARRSRAKSLWIPLAVCAAFVVILSTALWTALDQYELAPTGIPDASDQMLVLLLWFFPVTFAMLAFVLFRRGRAQQGSESMQ